MTSFRSRVVRLDQELHELRPAAETAGSDKKAAGKVVLPAAAPPPPAPPPEPKITEEDLARAYEKGIKEGQQQAQRELAKTVALLNSISKALEETRERLALENDAQVNTLSCAIARKILHRELKDPETTIGLIHNALKQVSTRSAMRIRLNPRDLELLEARRSLLDEMGQRLPEDVVLFGEPHIAPGGCLIDSASGGIDARMETQLRLIEEALNGGPAEEPGGAKSTAQSR